MAYQRRVNISGGGGDFNIGDALNNPQFQQTLLDQIGVEKPRNSPTFLERLFSGLGSFEWTDDALRAKRENTGALGFLKNYLTDIPRTLFQSINPGATRESLQVGEGKGKEFMQSLGITNPIAATITGLGADMLTPDLLVGGVAKKGGQALTKGGAKLLETGAEKFGTKIAADAGGDFIRFLGEKLGKDAALEGTKVVETLATHGSAQSLDNVLKPLVEKYGASSGFVEAVQPGITIAGKNLGGGEIAGKIGKLIENPLGTVGSEAWNLGRKFGPTNAVQDALVNTVGKPLRELFQFGGKTNENPELRQWLENLVAGKQSAETSGELLKGTAEQAYKGLGEDVNGFTSAVETLGGYDRNVKQFTKDYFTNLLTPTAKKNFTKDFGNLSVEDFVNAARSGTVDLGKYFENPEEAVGLATQFLNKKAEKVGQAQQFLQPLGNEASVFFENLRKNPLTSPELQEQARNEIEGLRGVINKTVLSPEQKTAYNQYADLLEGNIKTSGQLKGMGDRTVGLSYLAREYTPESLKNAEELGFNVGVSGPNYTKKRSFLTIGDMEIAKETGGFKGELTTGSDSFTRNIQRTKVSQDTINALHKSYTDLGNMVDQGQLAGYVEKGVPNKGMAKTGIKMLDDQGVVVRKDILPYIQDFHKYSLGFEEAKPLFDKLREIQGMWAKLQTGAGIKIGNKEIPLNPAFFTRNKLNNVFSAMTLGGVAPQDYVPLYKDARKVYDLFDKIVTQGEGNVGKLAEEKIGNYTAKSLFNDAKEAGIFGGSLAESINKDVQGLGDILKEGRKKLGNLTDVSNLGKRLEVEDKLVVFMNARLKGKTIEEARQKVVNSLFDYGQLTPFEQQVMKPLFTFYTWSKNNLVAHFRLFNEEPKRFKVYANVLESLQGLGADVPEDVKESMPDWMRNTINIPVGVGNGKLATITGLGTGLEALGGIIGKNSKQTGNNVLSMLNPLIGVPLQLTTGQSFFKEMPISDDTSAYQYKNLPSFMKKAAGVRVEKYTDAKGNIKETYKMNPYTKFLMENIVGRPLSSGAKFENLIKDDVNRNLGLVDLLTGVKYQERDISQMQRVAQQQQSDALLKVLTEYGIVKPQKGVYLSPALKYNAPEVSDFLQDTFRYRQKAPTGYNTVKGQQKKQRQQQYLTNKLLEYQASGI